MLSQRIRKHYYKSLGTSVINSLLSHLSLKNLSSKLFDQLFKYDSNHKNSETGQNCIFYFICRRFFSQRCLLNSIYYGYLDKKAFLAVLMGLYCFIQIKRNVNYIINACLFSKEAFIQLGTALTSISL